MTKKVRWGLIQYPLVSDSQANEALAFRYLRRIERHRPHYVVLPEMWLGSPNDPRARPKWISLYKRGFAKILDWCKDRKIGCFLSQLERRKDSFFNTAYFVNSQGFVQGYYRKIHLFSLGGETKIYNPGSQIRSFKSPMGSVGCVICYDIRFPELIRSLTFKGISLLVVCAQWPAARKEHWHTLLKARAIENQIFVVAVNRLGSKGRIQFGGGSAIYNPWGERVLHLPESRRMGIVDIDLSEVKRIRKKYPFLEERRI